METYEKHVKRKHEQQRVNCGEMTAWWRYVFIGTSSDCSSRDPSSNMRGNAYSLFVVCFRKTPRGSVNRNEDARNEIGDAAWKAAYLTLDPTLSTAQR